MYIIYTHTTRNWMYWPHYIGFAGKFTSLLATAQPLSPAAIFFSCHGPLSKNAIKFFCSLSVCSGVLIYMQHNFPASQMSGGHCSKNRIQHNYLNNAGTSHIFKLFIASAGLGFKKTEVSYHQWTASSVTLWKNMFFFFWWVQGRAFSLSLFLSELICQSF